MNLLLVFALVVGSVSTLQAQFDLEESHTTASLRGIDSLGAGVAWASGANGTILRTEDGGYLWQPCTVPTGGEKLDFRGVQGFDANTAVIMASGKGAGSRLYKTTDGCQTWKLVFEDPNAEGFFDALRKVTSRQMYLMGDPVGGRFAMFYSSDQGSTWLIADDPGLDAEKSDGAFAASNSSLIALRATLYFGTGGAASAHVYSSYAKCTDNAPKDRACPLAWSVMNVPLAARSSSAGVFSLAGHTQATASGRLTDELVAVGGDFANPKDARGTAAWSKDGGKTWSAATVGPGGYRSAVTFDGASQAFLAVGPSGADLSLDEGRHWKPIIGETATGWNAVSLPFVVGAQGRIGKLRSGVLNP